MRYLIFVLWPALAVASPTVYLFGGGDREPAALHKFVHEVPTASVLVITWATSVPRQSYQSIRTDLLNAGAHQIVHAITVTDMTSRQIFLSQLSQANLVFFSGGDQNEALDVIDQFNLRLPMQTAYRNGVVFAGTSAGTALIPEIAMTGDGDFTRIDTGLVATRPGLGLVDLLVDQHFLIRSRQNRLQSLLLDYPDKTAVGVDEDAAVRVSGNTFEAFGSSPATIYTTYMDDCERLIKTVHLNP